MRTNGGELQRCGPLWAHNHARGGHLHFEPCGLLIQDPAPSKLERPIWQGGDHFKGTDVKGSGVNVTSGAVAIFENCVIDENKANEYVRSKLYRVYSALLQQST